MFPHHNGPNLNASLGDSVMASRDLLSQDVLSQLLGYNPETGILTWKPRDPVWFGGTPGRSSAHACALWNKRYSGIEALSHVDAYGYKTGAILGYTCKAHRIVWLLETGVVPTQIDHINGVRTDNRFHNLRDVSAAENSKNIGRSKANQSGVVGVVWDKRAFKWIAQIGMNGAPKQIGRYDLFWDAVAARQKAEKEMGFHENHGRAV